MMQATVGISSRAINACERAIDRAPDVLVGRLLREALKLALQLLHLRRESRSAEQLQRAQAREAVADVKLVLSRHSSRRGAGDERRRSGARVAARPCRCGR